MSSDNYFYFNEAINDVFFDGRYQSIPIYLDLEDNERNEASGKVSLSPDDFDQELGSALASTICWDRPNIYEWHMQNLLKWSAAKSDNRPPFIALLLTFSLAAEHMRKGVEYSANNYYQRLAELLGITSEVSKNKLSAAGKYTSVFWQTLNQWLQRTDYIYGRPTAKQINNWKFVSYSLSQSLVRDGDKKNLQKMFVHFGFSPRQSFNESEIKLYLSEWMTTTGPSAWLKKLWANSELRERVVSAACTELESWDGNFSDSHNLQTPTKLTWAIAIKRFPRVRVNLFLTTPATDDDAFGDFLTTNKDSCSNTLKEALNNGGDLWLSQLSGSRVAYLEPISNLNINALLVFSFDLFGSKSKQYSHDVRPIIPLMKLEGSSIYREISKVSLFSSHIILCHNKWESMVNDYLSKHARPGFEISSPQEVEDLPLGWTLFANVEIVNIASDDVSNNLQCLVPLSEGEDIHLTGGLRLAPGVWHASAPPEIYATDGNGLLDVHIKKDVFSDESAQSFLELSSKYDPDFLKKIGDSLESKNLILCAVNGSKIIEKDISFRSAAIPRKLITYRNAELFYCSGADQNVNLCTASEIKETNKNRSSVRGLSFYGPHPNIPDSNNFEDIKEINSQFENPEEWKEYHSKPIEEDHTTCIVRGYHVWDVEFDSSSMTCKDCKQYQIGRKRGRRKNSVLARPPVANSNSFNNQIRDLNEKSSNRINIDIAYDAICYLGSGNWNRIQSILSEVVELPWHVSLVNQNLIDCGYIDQALKGGRFSPLEWSCCPPSLTITKNSMAFISGFRNRQLIWSIKEALAPVVEKYYTVENKENFLPTSHFWALKNADLHEIIRLIKNVKDPHGRNVEVQLSSGELIAASLPYISEIINSFPQIHIEARGEYEKFDFTTGRWRNSKLGGAGAYRTNFAGRRYFYYENGTSKEATHELVKLIAARNAGIRLHKYNLNESCLECSIGCDPPGLFKRALISCSGTLPEVKGGKTIYTQIPKSLGKLIMYKLYK